ncbi:hypothetical protein CXU19_07825 [Akkermansia muciniphila]|nr:hypothetical protein [Akkermansia muciniphila]PNC22999.1 hypothetical protein CXU19_07825 [Akkermansia muciniphila]PNC39356.1 hypothetical protein CXU20_07825 [Akkermansia muciniphila]
MVTIYAYASLIRELVSVSHNDDTTAWEFTYNHLGQMTSVRDTLVSGNSPMMLTVTWPRKLPLG